MGRCRRRSFFRAFTASGSAAVEFGMNQIVEVLTGAGPGASAGGATNNSRPMASDRSTAGRVGGHWARADPPGAQLRQVSRDHFGAGVDGGWLGGAQGALAGRLTRPVSAPETPKTRAGRLRAMSCCSSGWCGCASNWQMSARCRRISFSPDVTLRQVARDYPASERALARISGMSARKLQEFGRVLLAVVAGHLETQPRQIFARPPLKTTFKGGAVNAPGVLRCCAV